MGCNCGRTLQERTSYLAEKFSLISVKFNHGLGDCSNFAHQIPLYINRGYKVEVECTPDKRLLFEAAGAEITNAAKHVHHWPHAPSITTPTFDDIWSGNKAGYNLSHYPMPNIGTPAELWCEYCQVSLNLDQFVTSEIKEKIDNYLTILSQPLILVHFQGNTSTGNKNLLHDQQAEALKDILDQTDASIILLDWDKRVHRFNNYRLRHLTDDWHGLNIIELYYLITKADLLIGVDSGPLHLTRFTNTPALGLWTKHFPPNFILPRNNTVNLTHKTNHPDIQPYRRFSHNLISTSADELTGKCVAKYTCFMLGRRRYVSDISADCILKNLIQRCRVSHSDLTTYVDRHKSFDIILRFLQKIDSPTVLETGSIRAIDDFPAGYFGYIIGFFLSKHGGKLHTVEIDPKKADFARTWTKFFDKSVEIHTSHSHDWLRRFNGTIDLAYLDSADTGTEGYQECCLEEAKLVLPHLNKNAAILIDDTMWSKGMFIGKGVKAIKFLLENGFNIKYSGYQTLLTRQYV